jgi:hypothetical protein
MYLRRAVMRRAEIKDLAAAHLKVELCCTKYSTYLVSIPDL